MKHCFGSREELSVEIKELEKYFEKTSYSSKDPTDMLWGEVQIWSKNLNLFERVEDNFVVVPLGQLANWIFNSWKYISYHNYGSKDSLDQRFCPSGKCSMHDRYDSWEFNWPEHEPLRKRDVFDIREKFYKSHFLKGSGINGMPNLSIHREQSYIVLEGRNQKDSTFFVQKFYHYHGIKKVRNVFEEFMDFVVWEFKKEDIFFYDWGMKKLLE